MVCDIPPEMAAAFLRIEKIYNIRQDLAKSCRMLYMFNYLSARYGMLSGEHRRRRRRRARSLRVMPAQWAWWWFPLLRSFLIALAASRVLVIKLSFHCF